MTADRRIYMIRHGKADRKSAHRVATPRGPAADPPLDATGKEQAAALTRRLLKMPSPAAIYCSTLARARQTIEPFVEATGAEVIHLQDIAEWHGGEWEFKEFEEFLAEDPEMPTRVLLQDPLFHLAPGSEAFEEFRARVVDAVEGALVKHPEGDLWFVCHGGVINAYVGWVLGIEEQDMFILPAHTSINTIRVVGGRRLLWFLSDDAHVTEPELFPEA